MECPMLLPPGGSRGWSYCHEIVHGYVMLMLSAQIQQIHAQWNVVGQQEGAEQLLVDWVHHK